MKISSKENNLFNLVNAISIALGIISSLISIYQFSGIQSCSGSSERVGLSSIIFVLMVYFMIFAGVAARRVISTQSESRNLGNKQASGRIKIFQAMVSIPFVFLLAFMIPWSDFFYFLYYHFSYYFDFSLVRLFTILVSYWVVLEFCEYAAREIFALFTKS